MKIDYDSALLGDFLTDTENMQLNFLFSGSLFIIFNL